MKIDPGIVRLLEQKSKLDLSISRNCEALAKLISAETTHSLSRNTMKRILGFINDGHEPMAYTLDAIARYIGYYSWQELTSFIEKENSCWNVNVRQLCPSDLSLGEIIRIQYRPNASLALKYQGESVFQVEESQNSPLNPGDLLILKCITDGFPLIASQVIREGHQLGSFIAGRETGIQLLP